jgi:hypothetical protein
VFSINHTAVEVLTILPAFSQKLLKVLWPFQCLCLLFHSKALKGFYGLRQDKLLTL